VLGPRQQGDLGEVAALGWLVQRGAKVAIPVGHSPDYDLVADFAGTLHRVQVKTTRRRTPAGRWQAMLETHGGNQSWSGTVKRFDASRYDWLFVLVGDGRCWFIPAGAIEASSAICLGGPKYAEFEVDRGQPFAEMGVDVSR
jgi:hypothetical protein